MTSSDENNEQTFYLVPVRTRVSGWEYAYAHVPADGVEEAVEKVRNGGVADYTVIAGHQEIEASEEWQIAEDEVKYLLKQYGVGVEAETDGSQQQGL